jgi:hypothetical protein
MIDRRQLSHNIAMFCQNDELSMREELLSGGHDYPIPHEALTYKVRTSVFFSVSSISRITNKENTYF